MHYQAGQSSEQVRFGPTVTLQSHVECISEFSLGGRFCLQLCIDEGLPYRKLVVQIYVCVRTTWVSLGITGIRCQVSEKSEGRKQEKWVQLEGFCWPGLTVAAVDEVKKNKV